LVFAAPLPVGVIGLRELVDVYMRIPVSSEQLKALLSPVLPEGLKLEAVRRMPREAPALMAAVDRATYRFEGRVDRDLTQAAAESAVKALLRAEEIRSVRQGKDGKKERNIRPGIISLDVQCVSGSMTGTMTVRAGQQGNVRPEEVIKALLRTGLPGDPLDFTYYRTGLFSMVGNRMVSLG
jgi:radical SAM-linked protein